MWCIFGDDDLNMHTDTRKWKVTDKIIFAEYGSSCVRLQHQGAPRYSKGGSPTEIGRSPTFQIRWFGVEKSMETTVFPYIWQNLATETDRTPVRIRALLIGLSRRLSQSERPSARSSSRPSVRALVRPPVSLHSVVRPPVCLRSVVRPLPVVVPTKKRSGRSFEASRE